MAPSPPISHIPGSSPWRLGHPALLLLLVFITPALWIVFVSTTNTHELLVGVLTSAASIAFTVFVCRSSSTNLRLRLPDVLQCWRIPWYILSGIWDITQVLLKDLLGIVPAKNLFRVCGFDSGTHDPVRVARTVLAIAYTTTAPNFIVIGIDPTQSRMLFHQIAPSSIPLMTRALGAKA